MAKHFIQGAIKHPGALHKELHVPEGKKIPEGKLEKAAHAGGKLGKRARFAETLEGLHHGGRKEKGHAERDSMLTHESTKGYHDLPVEHTSEKR